MQHADDNTGFNPIEFDGIKTGSIEEKAGGLL